MPYSYLDRDISRTRRIGTLLVGFGLSLALTRRATRHPSRRRITPTPSGVADIKSESVAGFASVSAAEIKSEALAEMRRNTYIADALWAGPEFEVLASHRASGHFARHPGDPRDGPPNRVREENAQR